jgi:putative transposase
MQVLPSIPPVRPPPVAGPRLAFGKQDRLLIKRVAYTCVDSTPETYSIARVDNPTIAETIPRAEMDALRLAPDFRHDRNFYNPGAAHARIISGVAHLRDLPETEQKKILWKQDWCLRYVKTVEQSEQRIGVEKAIAAIKAEMMKDAEKKAGKGKRRTAGQQGPPVIVGPSGKHLKRWVETLIAGNMNALALRDRRCLNSGNWTSRYCAEVDAVMYKHAARFGTPGVTRTLLHEAMEVELTERNLKIEALNVERKAQKLPLLDLLEIPDYDRFRDEVNALPEFQVMAGRRGPEVARNYYRAVTGGLVDIVRPLQRVEIDEWTVHLHVLLIRAGLWDTLSDKEKKMVDRVRMVLCVAIDCATRCILAMKLARTANPRNAIGVLDMALSDKQPYADAAGALTPWDPCGNWETAVTDAGTTFAAHEFAVRVTDAGITFEIAPAGVPFLRGTVERALRSMDDKLVKRFAGRTGSNVVDKGDYDSEANASLFVDELAEAFVRYVVDHYHNTPHAGLRGETPRACWLRLTEQFGVIPPPDATMRRAIFGIPMRATADADGIRVLGLQYHAPEIGDRFDAHGATDVEVRVDPKDIGVISVKIGDAWLTIEGPEEIAGIHMDDWIAAEAELRRRHADMAKLTRSLVLAAAKYVNDLADGGRKRINISDPPMSSLALARAHRQKNIGVSFVADTRAAREANVGLFDGAIDVTGTAPPEVAPGPATASRKTAKGSGGPKSRTQAKTKPVAARSGRQKKPRAWRYE